MLAALGTVTYWIVNDSHNQQQRQAHRIQAVAIEALALSKANPKSLQGLLGSITGSPMFVGLEIGDKNNTLLKIRFDHQQPSWTKALQLPAFAPIELPLNTGKALSIKFLPEPSFFAYRLTSLAPMALITMVFTLLVANLLFWFQRKRFRFSSLDQKRLASAMPVDDSQGEERQAEPAGGDILDSLPDAILRCRCDGQILYSNAVARQWLHPSQRAAELANVLDLIAPWDRKRCAEALSRAHHPGNQEYFDTQAVGSRRGIMPVIISFAVLAENELFLVLRDASASRALQDQLNVRDLLLNTLPKGLAVISPRDNGELLYGNPAFKALLHIDDRSQHSGAWLDDIHRYAPAFIIEQLRSAIGQSTNTAIEFSWHAPDSGPRTLQLQLFPVEPGDPRLICSLQDCSEEASQRQHFQRELTIRRRVLDEMPIGFCVADSQANICMVNTAFARFTANDPSKLIGSPITNWLPNPSAKEHLYQREHTFETNNERRFARLNSLPMILPEGEKECAYFFEDITSFKLRALADSAALDRLQQTLDGIADGIITTNEHGFIQHMNPYAQRLTGLAEHQYKGIPFGQAIQLIDEKKREPLVDPAIRAIRIGKTVKFRQDVLYVGENKQDLAVEISATPVYDSMKTVTGAVVVMKDVAEQRSLAQQMQLKASRDPLTGLINRRELLSLLESLQYEVEEQSRQHTLCYMDLDKFKVVNDTCGHNAGDELLRQVSNLMNDCLRTSDILARIGGDEFCAVLCNTPVENANLVAEKIREAVKHFRFTWDNKFFEIGVSIGLFGLQPGLSVEETISASDHACYNAKEEGRDCVYISSASKPGAVKPISAPWSERLAEALDHDYFRLFYLDAEALKKEQSLPNYHEVLFQLHEPHQAALIASAFMPNAQRLNLTASIERWIIGKLFSTIGSCALDSPSTDIFAIHLSAITLTDGNFITFLSEQSKRHGVSPGRVCFEIDEDDLVQNFSAVQRFMLDGKKSGYGFCLSKFGGGISSFAYLRNLPLDFLKIDGSLTHRLASDPIDSIIVRAIQSIGQHMQIRVIAQHIPGQNTKDFLATMGIDYAQGPSNALTALETGMSVHLG